MHAPHSLMYLVEPDRRHLVNEHGLDAGKVNALLLDHGTAMYFATLSSLHSQDHELALWREAS